MEKFVIQALESLLLLLVHHPKDVDLILADIRQFLNAGSNKEVRWAVIVKALDNIAGDSWDVSLLIVAIIAPRINKNIRTHWEHAKNLSGSFLDLDLLLIQEERTAVLKAFRESSLETLLRTQGSPHAKVITAARWAFLYDCLKTLTINLLHPHKMAYYKKATGRIFDMTSSADIDRAADECFQYSFEKFSSRFSKLLPYRYQVYFQQTMRREWIGMQKESEVAGRILVAGDVDDSGE